jgi:cytidylate kinase
VIVAIDGPAGSGKSTVAQRAAEATGFAYLDSGMLYRGISKAVLDSGNDPENSAAVVQIASRCRFEMAPGGLLMNGAPLAGIHTDRIDRWSAIHSAIVEVRKAVNAQIRRIAGEGNFIVMGRDIGTVVFPHARLKFFLDASIEARAARRYRQGREGGKAGPGQSGASRMDAEEVRRNMEQRDSIDRDKPFGRLERAPGAIYIDTSDLTIDQVCDRVVREILKVTRNQSGVERGQ